MLNENFTGDALFSFPRLSHERRDQRRSISKGLELLETSKWNTQFPLGNSVWDDRSTFQEVLVFSRNFPFGETKLHFI